MSEKLRWVRRPRTRVKAEEPKRPRKRRRCDNCNKLYRPTRDDQKFCRDRKSDSGQVDPDRCRKEYYRYGSSYGPLKTGLHNAIDKKHEDLKKFWQAIFVQQEKLFDEKLKRLRVEVAELRSQIDAARGQNKIG